MSSKKTANKNKKSKLPMSLVIVGLLELILPLYLSWSIVIPSLQIASHVGVNSVNMLSFLPFGIIIVLLIAQLVYGFWLRQKQHKAGMLNASQRKHAILVLTASIVVYIISLPFTLIFAIAPLYSLLSEIK